VSRPGGKALIETRAQGCTCGGVGGPPLKNIKGGRVQRAHKNGRRTDRGVGYIFLVFGAFFFLFFETSVESIERER
jgi:hypothetical protein